MDLNDKAKRLKSILEQYDPAIFDTRVTTLERLRVNTTETESVSKSVDSTIETLGRDKVPDLSKMIQVEAIILPKYRPAIDIRGNRYHSPPPPWHETFNNPEVKGRLEGIVKSVGRIEVPGLFGASYVGTGFIVAPDLIMTNRHVAEIFARGVGIDNISFRFRRTAEINFLREIIPPIEEVLSLTVKKIVMVHPFWDMALLKIEGVSPEQAPLRLSTTHPDDLAEREIAVIGYPAQDPRSDIDLQNTIFKGVFDVKRLLPGKIKQRRVVDSFNNRVNAITHDASTLGGNSGSAVIDVNSGEVLALHFAGIYLDANFAVPAYELARDPRVIAAGVSFNGSVENRNDLGEVWSEADPINEGQNPAQPDPAPSINTMPDALTTKPASLSFTIPLTITIDVGEIQAATNSQPQLHQQPEAPKTEVNNEGLFGGDQEGDKKIIADARAAFNLDKLNDGGFSWQTALAALSASHLAYSEANEVSSVCINEWQFETCRFIRRNDTECFIASNASIVLLAFRGTTNIQDWIRDLRIFSTERSYGDVHKGFYEGFAQVRGTLETILSTIDASNKKIVITGHSLGGALASIAAAEWKNKYPITAVYTFGQPTVGKQGFKTYMESSYPNFFRIVNDDDIIPMLPPNYTHIKTLKHLGVHGEVITESMSINEEAIPGNFVMAEVDFGVLQGVLSASENTTNDEVLLPSFKDHRTVGYMKQILKLKNTQP